MMRLLPFQQLLRTKNVSSNRLVAQSFGNFRPAFLTLFDGRVSRPLPVGRGRRCFSIEATQQAKKSSYGSSQSANTLGWYSLVGGALAAAATASLCAQSSPEGSANNSWDDQNIFTMKAKHNFPRRPIFFPRDGQNKFFLDGHAPCACCNHRCS